jgi:predicted RNase H-like HicB family nuclease
MYHITFDKETDERWIAAIESLPGVLAYGDTKEEAEKKVVELAEEVTNEL